MSYLINTNELKEVECFYGGNAGLKDTVIINNEKWIAKFPQDLKIMKRVTIPYSTGPLSEFLGSKIFEKLGFKTHETKLGYRYNTKNGKIQMVVLCKDFTQNGKFELIDYEKIKNKYSDELSDELEKCRSKIKNQEEPLFIDHHTNIEEILVQFKHNDFLNKHPEIKKHFWKMMVVDFLINNNDRNRTNWGFLKNTKTGEFTIAPIYDNGACFKTKDSDEKMRKVLSDENKFMQSAGNGMTHYVFNNHHCNFASLFNWMEKNGIDKELKEAIVELTPIIVKKLPEIKKMIMDMPEKENDIQIISKTQKEYYVKHLEYILNKQLLPRYEKYQKGNNKNIQKTL